MVLTGGGDCPGLNAVLRAIVKTAKNEGNWDVYGSIEAFNGILSDPPELMHLTNEIVRGIHIQGGTIIKTTNKGNPMSYPVKQADGSYTFIDKTGELIQRLKDHGFHAVINIGGDGSQTISQHLFENGVNIVGVPKTIDNDLSATNLTFGFSTAVQIATDSFDKLVTTAASHNRVMILEVMGRNAGWIALYTALAGGAEICLIPEIPFRIDKIKEEIHKRYKEDDGFVNIVIAEGARIDDEIIATKNQGDENIKLGGIGNVLRRKLEEHGLEPDVRVATLGHIQRGGTPIAFDRILATAFGVKAFELVKEGKFGQMVTYKKHQVQHASIKSAIAEYKFINSDHYLVKTARKIGIAFGD
ncbi:MAG: ATP-dependent 6-phosphofructokinase [Saprospiraceae bacterium]|nr:ATP-dependent 6-phosphofructokinase [Saprospiraceae bacterium]